MNISFRIEVDYETYLKALNSLGSNLKNKFFNFRSIKGFEYIIAHGNKSGKIEFNNSYIDSLEFVDSVYNWLHIKSNYPHPNEVYLICCHSNKQSCGYTRNNIYVNTFKCDYTFAQPEILDNKYYIHLYLVEV